MLSIVLGGGASVVFSLQHAVSCKPCIVCQQFLTSFFEVPGSLLLPDIFFCHINCMPPPWLYRELACAFLSGWLQGWLPAGLLLVHTSSLFCLSHASGKESHLRRCLRHSAWGFSAVLLCPARRWPPGGLLPCRRSKTVWWRSAGYQAYLGVLWSRRT